MARCRRLLVECQRHASFRTTDIAAVVQLDLAHLAGWWWLGHGLRETTKQLQARLHDEVTHTSSDNDIDDRSHGTQVTAT
mgnify:CR=1 FL=1